MRQALVVFALILTPSPGVWAQATPTPAAAHSQVDPRWGVKIPMRDGVELNATLCPNSIYLEKNSGARGVVAEESRRDAHVTHVALYHDHTHPSYVEIPIAAAP